MAGYDGEKKVRRTDQFAIGETIRMVDTNVYQQMIANAPPPGFKVR